ncbi:RecBCD enzyme subunit RecC [Gammaproteobacteria bacterium]
MVLPGFAVIHSNFLENLRFILLDWLKKYPLAPLENEIFLVQSNGMAQWLKLALANELGICTAVNMELPAQFLWTTYKIVLGDIPKESPLDRDSLIWRLFRVLRSGRNYPELEQIYNADTDKQYQLSKILADVFDQYQVYRSDWIQDWTNNKDQIRDVDGKVQPMPQAWQAALWRKVLPDISIEEINSSRALAHQKFIEKLKDAKEPPKKLPKRILVFGISSMPRQTLEAFAQLGKFCQVLILVHNPCRYYWGDIVGQEDILRKKINRKPKISNTPLQDLHVDANPLLASWGRQGKDYIHFLDELLEDPQQYQTSFQRIDLFADFEDPKNLLQQIQQSILDLEPSPKRFEDQKEVNMEDFSVVFHSAHSQKREVEILHDQLLDLLSKQEGKLKHRDILVMVPDINSYAPHIHAVFGKSEVKDSRQIPFSISDQKERGKNPILIALEFLLRIPDSRFFVSDLFELLSVPSVQKSFGISEQDLPVIRHWVINSGIRWGLNAEQRKPFCSSSDLEQNTWRFGLDRMLLGYAVGSGKSWEGIEPYDEMSGLSAEKLGFLAHLMDVLEKFWDEFSKPVNVETWGKRFRNLLKTFFVSTDDRDLLMLEKLFKYLERWEELCQQAKFDETLPISVAREAWLSKIDQPSLSQNFLVGRVNFCTLLPMRAIPFEVICLLGMNDGDFPRNFPVSSIDLMAVTGYRPGDRSRREDDRYLFLETVLSARKKLYISWVGQDEKNNQIRVPSILVQQLRDFISLGWVDSSSNRPLLDRLTVQHPLHPFSKRYFLSTESAGYDERIFSYAHEWCAAYDPQISKPSSNLPFYSPEVPISIKTLTSFLRYPTKIFFKNRLQVALEKRKQENSDVEPFVLSKLDDYSLGEELLSTISGKPPEVMEFLFEEKQAQQKRRGELPMSSFAEQASKRFSTPVRMAYQRSQQIYRSWPYKVGKPKEIFFEFSNNTTCISLEGWISDLYTNEEGQYARILVRHQNLRDRKYALIDPWVYHLSGCAAGLNMCTLQVGSDVVISFPTIPKKDAYGYLEKIVHAWCAGMENPLPLACKTAFAWLQNPRDAYTKEVQEDFYLRRAYPTFELLMNSLHPNNFEYWARELYEPILKKCRIVPD